MLIVMDRRAQPEEIEAVCRRAHAAGLRTNVIAGKPTVVELNGEATAEDLSVLTTSSGVFGLAGASAASAPVTSNLRIARIRPLVSPAILMEGLPLPPESAGLVQSSRNAISRILDRDDDRVLIVVGPCSIHDADAALEYARRLEEVATALRDDLLIVMRVYFEKPRTTVGWKGLINDPHGDESFAVNDGLRIARKLLLDVLALGLPAGCEFLDPISPQFISDAVSWAAIGARTTESQVHRNLTSGLSMPVGFKNGTGGDVQMAIDAIAAASYPHHFMSVTEQGLAAIVETRGNADTHVILRGGRSGPNFDHANVERTLTALTTAGQQPRVMIDASHGNSGKDHRQQAIVAGAIADEIAGGERGIVGVMLESFLEDGRQDPSNGHATVFGQSITDACMGWDMTVPVLRRLAESVRARRAAVDAVPV
jgi:3-deoxy-7-phosphoheptulonate synthase